MTRVFRRGFTIIELLIVIGVIGVFIALAIPALSAARANARVAAGLSNLRQCHQAFHHYLDAHVGVYPWAPAGTEFALSPEDPASATITPGYWDLSIYWPSLFREVTPWREWFGVFVGPGSVPRDALPWARPNHPMGVATYRLSHAFFARPQLWMPGTTDAPSLYRPVSASDVIHPSRKVLLFDYELTHLGARSKGNSDLFPMVFADGHCVQRRLSEAVPPFKPTWKESAFAVLDTPDGANGIDY